MIKWMKKKRLDNKGSAIVMAIVLVAFLTILATTILYMSGMNYYMKMTDIRTKESFYGAEEVMEVIKAEFIKMSDEAYKEAYLSTMKQYAAADGATRQYNFKTEYFNILRGKWLAKVQPDESNPAFTYAQVLTQIAATGSYPAGSSYTITCTGTDFVVNESGYAVLEGIELTYVSGTEGYTAIISTDFLFLLPEMNWNINGSKKDWDAADTDRAAALSSSKVDMSENVQYYHWMKK